MSERLKQIVKNLERFKELNKEDIPELIEEIKKLEDSEKLAWDMVDKLEKEMGAFR